MYYVPACCTSLAAVLLYLLYLHIVLLYLLYLYVVLLYLLYLHVVLMSLLCLHAVLLYMYLHAVLLYLCAVLMYLHPTSLLALMCVCARWRADQDGPNGITPLHLAALQEDARLALTLLDTCPEQAFTKLVTRDGEHTTAGDT